MEPQTDDAKKRANVEGVSNEKAAKKYTYRTYEMDDGTQYQHVPDFFAGMDTMSEPVVTAREKPIPDALLDTVANRSRIVTTCRDAETFEANAIGHYPWETTTIAGNEGEEIHITTTPAKHGPWWIPRGSNVLGFVLEWEGQHHGGVYISGDTVFFGGIREIAERYKIGTAILHLGAVNFWPPWPPFVRFTFNGREAVKCAKLLDAPKVIPIHYERSVWSHFRESVASYTEQFAAAGLRNRVQWLEHGKRIEIEV